VEFCHHRETLDNLLVILQYDNPLVIWRIKVNQRKHDEQYQVTWLVRRLFRAMAQNATDRLANLNVTAADRAVLEFLYVDKELTVPEIASRYQVSRQHVQVTANGLIEQKLIHSKPNPSHKRSSLLVLTSKGRKLFERIRKSDEQAIAEIFASVSLADATTTRRTLQTLLDRLQ
jgi:DNA-binding MarR family transcriptional regulator